MGFTQIGCEVLKMRNNKIIIGSMLLMILVGVVTAAVIPKDNWDFKNYYNLSNIANLSADYLSGNIQWNNTYDYPVACPGSSAITALNDSVTCSDLWVDMAGDNMTGNLNSTANITADNLIGNGVYVRDNITLNDENSKIQDSNQNIRMYFEDGYLVVEG